MTMTVPDVCRYTIHGTWTNGHVIDNVVDMQIDTTGSTELRAEAVELVAADIIQNWQSQIVPVVTNNYIVTGISWVDLDQEDGTTGELPPDSGEIVQSAEVAASAPPHVCYLAKKLTSSARGQRKGRMYIAGIPEVSINEDGVLATDAGSAPVLMQSALDTFLENINQEDPGPDTHQAFMVVVHLGPRPVAPAPDNRVGTYTLVSALQLDPVVATQRRRLR